MLAFNSHFKQNADCSADLISRAFIRGLCSGNGTSFQLVFAVTHHHEESIQTEAPPAVTFTLWAQILKYTSCAAKLCPPTAGCAATQSALDWRQSSTPVHLHPCIWKGLFLNMYQAVWECGASKCCNLVMQLILHGQLASFVTFCSQMDSPA